MRAASPNLGRRRASAPAKDRKARIAEKKAKMLGSAKPQQDTSAQVFDMENPPAWVPTRLRSLKLTHLKLSGGQEMVLDLLENAKNGEALVKITTLFKKHVWLSKEGLDTLIDNLQELRDKFPLPSTLASIKGRKIVYLLGPSPKDCPDVDAYMANYRGGYLSSPDVFLEMKLSPGVVLFKVLVEDGFVKKVKVVHGDANASQHDKRNQRIAVENKLNLPPRALRRAPRRRRAC